MTSARDLTQQLGGKWYRSYGCTACPVCQPERHKLQNALTLSDSRSGRLLAHCKKSHCAFADILTACGIGPGEYQPPDPHEAARREKERKAQIAKRARQAFSCFQESLPVEGTLAEVYLREARGITCPLPSALRFHPEAWHGPSAKRYPALVARVDNGETFAVHRTYLSPEGAGKADIAPNKAMLGAVTGGAVRLTDAPGRLAVAEGIETALSLASGLLRKPASVWAALSTSGLRSVRLPPVPSQLTIAPDGDAAGREAARSLAERASALSWTVSLLPAPNGRDWNDILIMKGESA